MNFLAHAYLSGTSPEIITGNFIGDFVKGKQMDNFSKPIQNGIKLHREIDFYTDHHPIVLSSKQRLQKKYRHYSSVIVDMYYDHFLANSWTQWHHETLEEYSEMVYGILEEKEAELPEKFNYMLPFMRRRNWLLSYSQVEGIHSALSGMAKRTKFNSKMELASVDLKDNYSEFESEFQIFFPDIINFTAKFDFVKR